MRCKAVGTVPTHRLGEVRSTSAHMSFYSTDPQAAGRTPAETNCKAAGNMVGYMHLLNEETPEALAGTHRWVRCHDDAEGAKRLIRGEDGYVMRETDCYIRMVPVRT
ncbi:hypothetical protein GCM10011335_38200 [Aureimonas glaciei]|uniref:Uncharacterized protein n=2 Tax=Aureimonas glaciei TaxID=1776957 RepID=A0A916Y5N0_9HYPH|nr:hypothetical protein GCM10011335_38200 [Aureimonas glaciei]